MFLAAVWGLAAGLIWYGSSLTLWRDGSIGPGAYPLAALGGLLMLATVLLAKALHARELRLYSPFQPGLEDDLQLRQLASAMTQETGIPLRVVTKDGEGRFSSLWKGLRDSRTGDVLTVVSSDMTMLPNFHAAAFCSGRLEPIGGLFFDPDVLVVHPDSDWTSPGDLQGGSDPLRLGFGHHPDVDHAVDQWLSATAPFQFTPTYSDDAAGLIASLRNGELDALTLSLSQCQQALEAGQLRCIGVFSDHELPRAAGKACSLSEHGPAVFSGHWAALMVSAGIATERKSALSDAFVQVMTRLAPDQGDNTSTRDWHFLSDVQMKQIIATQQRCLSVIRPENAAPAMPSGKSAGLAVAIGGLAIFPAVMSAIGFPLTAFIFLTGLMLLLCPTLSARRIASSVAIAAAITVAVHLIFTRVFGVVMPDPSLMGGLAWPIF